MDLILPMTMAMTVRMSGGVREVMMRKERRKSLRTKRKRRLVLP